MLISRFRSSVLLACVSVAIGMDAQSQVLAETPQQAAFGIFASSARESVVTVASATAEKTSSGSKKKKDTDPGDRRSMSNDGSVLSDDFTDEILKGKPGEASRQLSSMGSGFVIDPSGLILTNNHVIDTGDTIFVILHDGTELKVDKIIGRDVKTDIALLKVTPKLDKPLRAVTFGDSSRLRVGDWLVAIGNPFGLGGTVTAGILSGIGRDINAGPYDEFLQTDASINRGNSGGPLFNARGEVVGINTAIFSPSGGSIGLGFAIPSNTARRVLEQLQLYGEVRWGTLGVRIQSVTDDLFQNLGLDRAEGALLARVNEGGSAANAGLLEGDVILAFAGTPIRNARQLPKIISQWRVGDEVDILILRNKQRQSLRVKIGLLEDKPALPKKVERGASPKRQKLSMLEFQSLSEDLRQAFSLLPDVEGVIVAKAAPDDAMASGLQAGDVVLEAAHQKVRTLDEFQSRILTLRQTARKDVLLTVQQPGGGLGFVRVDLDDD